MQRKASPPSMVPFAYKYPSTFSSLVELTTTIPLTPYPTPSNHATYCDSLAAAAATRAVMTTQQTPRNTHLRKSFTIEAILGLDSSKQISHSREESFSYGPIKETDLRRRNRPTPYSFPSLLQPNNKVSSILNDKEVKLQLDDSLNSKPAKSKRVRTIFTPEQLERLESEFERQQYMVGPERLYLAAALNLTEAQVKVWFQNRRIKWRKQNLELQQAHLAKLRCDVDGQRSDELDSSSEDDN